MSAVGAAFEKPKALVEKSLGGKGAPKKKRRAAKPPGEAKEAKGKAAAAPSGPRGSKGGAASGPRGSKVKAADATQPVASTAPKKSSKASARVAPSPDASHAST
mmetsp:Transcript_27884/g.71458  ORF Transcript_27884/g.71458 Transcript_27884/m.71458 type:complete len:104 (+) Transcript_27884:1255-1566(+)